MEPRELIVGDVVQLHPERATEAFRACLMIVVEPKSFGAMGFVSIPHKDGPRAAYYRVSWADMEYVGRAPFMPAEA